MSDNDGSITELVELIKDIRIAMFTTVGSEGHLTARPMAQQETEFDGDLWFFVESDSRTAQNLAANPQANVSLSSNSTWISLSGKGVVVHDVEKAKELWNSWVEAWLPQGPEGENVALIKFEAQTAEYWNTPGGRVSSLLSFAKAKLTGQPYDGGTNATVRLDDAGGDSAAAQVRA